MTRTNRALVTLRQELAITHADEVADDVLYEAERDMDDLPFYAYYSVADMYEELYDDYEYDYDYGEEYD